MILQGTHILRTGYHVICLHVTVPFCLVGAPFAFMYLILLQIARYNVPGTLGTLTQSSSRRPFSHIVHHSNSQTHPGIQKAIVQPSHWMQKKLRLTLDASSRARLL